jgi:hypothetical protein
MRRILVVVVALSLVAAVVAGAAKAGTAEVEFSGGAGGFSPCNGEFVSGSGPGFAVVSEQGSGGQVLIHFSMRLDMTGSFGNAYSVWLYANKAFAAPTANLGGGLLYFDVPVHQIAASTTAPSYTSNYFVRIYVLNGQPVAGVFMGPATQHCA